jgi:hypothetical protein
MVTLTVIPLSEPERMPRGGTKSSVTMAYGLNACDSFSNGLDL